MNLYIYIAIYLLGVILAFIQDRKNDRLLLDEPRTNLTMLIGLLFSLFSWVWFIIGLSLFMYYAKLPKFKYWLKQESKY
jgi:Na+/H+ antiporter NhaC